MTTKRLVGSRSSRNSALASGTTRSWRPLMRVTGVAGNRAVLEVLAHLTFDGREQAWPVAVVAQSADDRSVVFRSYSAGGRGLTAPPPAFHTSASGRPS
jgi:hypothetical protein